MGCRQCSWRSFRAACARPRLESRHHTTGSTSAMIFGGGEGGHSANHKPGQRGSASERREPATCNGGLRPIAPSRRDTAHAPLTFTVPVMTGPLWYVMLLLVRRLLLDRAEVNSRCSPRWGWPTTSAAVPRLVRAASASTAPVTARRRHDRCTTINPR